MPAMSTRFPPLALVCLVVSIAACTGGGGGTSGSDDDDDDGGANPLPAPEVSLAAGFESLTLSWEPVAGAASYRVYVDEAPVDPMAVTPVEVAAGPYVAAALPNWVEQHVRVSAVDAEAVEGDLSAEVRGVPVAGWFVTQRFGETSIDVTRADVAAAPVVTVADRSLVLDPTGAQVSIRDEAGDVVAVLVGKFHDNNALYAEIAALRGETVTVLAAENADTLFQVAGYLDAPDGLRVVLHSRDKATYALEGVLSVRLDGTGALTLAGEPCGAFVEEDGVVLACDATGELRFSDGVSTPVTIHSEETLLPELVGIVAGRLVVCGGVEVGTWSIALAAPHEQLLGLGSGCPIHVAEDGRMFTRLSGPVMSAPDHYLYSSVAGTAMSGIERATSEDDIDLLDVTDDGSRVVFRMSNREDDGVDHVLSVPLDPALATFGWDFSTDARAIDGGYVVVDGATVRVKDIVGQAVRDLDGTFLEDAAGEWAVTRAGSTLRAENVDGVAKTVLSTAVSGDARESLLTGGTIVFLEDDDDAFFATLDGSVLEPLPSPATGIVPLGAIDDVRIALRLTRETGAASFGVVDPADGTWVAVVTTAGYGAFIPR